MRVAFLGLGTMGTPMAAHLARAGHTLTVWNRTPGRAEPLAALGARVAGSPAEAVARAAACVTMLSGPEAVRAVLSEVAGAMPAGGLVVDASTVGPDVSREVAGLLAARGLRFVDAPVAGSVQPATEGTLGVLAGGADADVAEARPLLELWGDPERIRHVGPVGAGSAMKLVLNLTLGVAMSAVGEALRLGADLGLDRGAVLDVLEASPVGFTARGKRAMLEAGRYEPVNFSLDLMAKDLGLCVAEAGRPLRVTEAVLAVARAASGAGQGGYDYSALAGYLAESP